MERLTKAHITILLLVIMAMSYLTLYVRNTPVIVIEQIDNTNYMWEDIEIMEVPNYYTFNTAFTMALNKLGKGEDKLFKWRDRVYNVTLEEDCK